MSHGCQEFFAERERCRRRVSSICVVVGLATLASLWLPETPPFRRALKDIPILRFGFAGPTQYVRLVQIESSPGYSEPLIDVGQVVPAHGRKGGGGEPVVSPKAAKRPTSQRNLPRGPGEDKSDLLRRALAGHARVPIFQSNELIIEHLVRPEYPDDARERGIEGHVAVIAHVDTLGAVTEAEVMAASGEDQLDLAATSAVKQCKFKPYRVEGAAREVYAVFRFSFRIY